MRLLIRMSVMLAGVFLVFASTNANASDWYGFEVKVPFPFVVNGHTLPAGQYMVDEEGASRVLIHGEKGNHAAVFLETIPATRQEPVWTKPALTFTRYENQYRLSNVWETGKYGFGIIDRSSSRSSSRWHADEQIVIAAQ